MIRSPLAALGVVVVLAVAGCGARETESVASALPARLTDADFWQLSTEWSEPDGFFRSDTPTSNELLYQHVIPSLLRRVRPGEVYLGVGPEQNFTYIAAVQPALGVIVDIRRRNLQLHLMYKALFELAADRADFVSKLFAKPTPGGLGVTSSAAEIFEAFGGSPASEVLYAQTRESIVTHLTGTRGLPLSAADLEGITGVYEMFYRRGFAVRFMPTYKDLMVQTDGDGVSRSFLASEDRFQTVKALHATNRIIPVVGDFAGPTTLRAVGGYLSARAATVSTFYLSNVEQYLEQDGKWTLFCRNVAALPLSRSSTFIRAIRGGPTALGGYGALFVSRLGRMSDEVRRCAP